MKPAAVESCYDVVRDTQEVIGMIGWMIASWEAFQGDQTPCRDQGKSKEYEQKPECKNSQRLLIEFFSCQSTMILQHVLLGIAGSSDIFES